MEEGCNLAFDEKDQGKIEESIKEGREYQIDPEILEEVGPRVEMKMAADIQREIAFEKEEGIKNGMKELLPQRTEEFDKVERVIERVEKVTSLISPEVKEKDVLVLPYVPQTQKEYFKSDIIKDIKRIGDADPYKTIVITTERNVPVFTTDFKHSGEKLSEHIKNYPRDYPEVKVYTPVFPTKDNLKRMLIMGNAPLSPWGQKVELHHYQQDPKGPLMMIHEKFHDEVPHLKNGLRPEERAKYNNVQKPNIYKMAAKAYLGDRLEDFKAAMKL